MYNNESSASSLDQEYLELLQDIKPYITCIINKHYLGLIKVWMERLSNEDFGQKYHRNSYLQRLYKQLEAGVLEYPFTDLPPEGELLGLSDDENDSFHAAREALSARSDRYRSPTRGQGDVPMINNTPGAKKPADDESSWLDVSDYSSEKASDHDDRNVLQTKILDQLRYENNELKKRLHRNDTNIAVNANLNEKIIELQKQLASSMLRNVELQKNVQTRQDQTEQFQAEITQQHQKELELLGTQCEQTLAEREENLKQIIEKFTKKYQALRDRYVHKLTDQERSFHIKCAVYKQKINEMKGVYQEQASLLKQKQADDASQLESCAFKIQQLQEEHKQALDALRNEQLVRLEESCAESKSKHEAQLAQCKKCMDEERAKNQQQSVDKLQQHLGELQRQREKHQQHVADMQAQFQKELQEQRDNTINNAGKDLADLDEYRAQCEQLTKQIETISDANKTLTAQMDEDRKHGEEQRALLLSQIAGVEEENAAHQLQLAEQATTHGQQMEAIQRTHAEQKEAHDLEVQQLQRTIKKHQVERQKMLNKIQININEHQKALEGQISDSHKMEMMWREELLRVLDVMKKLRTDKEKSKEEVHRLEKEVVHLQEVVNKVTALHHKTEKDYCRKFRKIACEFHMREHKYRVMLSAKATSPRKMEAYDKIIISLEEKYKRSLEEQFETGAKEREKYLKRISELELHLGMSLLNDMND